MKKREKTKRKTIKRKIRREENVKVMTIDFHPCPREMKEEGKEEGKKA